MVSLRYQPRAKLRGYRQRTIDQCDHRADILAVIREHGRGIDDDVRIVATESRIAGDHESQRMSDSAVMMAFTMPSAKYSCAGSPLMFWNASSGDRRSVS
jgi:hypothetical protein